MLNQSPILCHITPLDKQWCRKGGRLQGLEPLIFLGQMTCQAALCRQPHFKNQIPLIEKLLRTPLIRVSWLPNQQLIEQFRLTYRSIYIHIKDLNQNLNVVPCSIVYHNNYCGLLVTLISSCLLQFQVSCKGQYKAWQRKLLSILNLTIMVHGIIYHVGYDIMGLSSKLVNQFVGRENLLLQKNRHSV